MSSSQWEKKVEEGQKNFDSCSKVLKREVKKFEVRLDILVTTHRDLSHLLG